MRRRLIPRLATPGIGYYASAPTTARAARIQRSGPVTLTVTQTVTITIAGTGLIQTGSGGKRRLLKHMYPLFPKHQCYVEPFAGGAAALLMNPNPAPLEILNDINGEPDIRLLFDGFTMRTINTINTINTSYSIGGAHHQTPAAELIITP